MKDESLYHYVLDLINSVDMKRRWYVQIDQDGNGWLCRNSNDNGVIEKLANFGYDRDTVSFVMRLFNSLPDIMEVLYCLKTGKPTLAANLLGVNCAVLLENLRGEVSLYDLRDIGWHLDTLPESIYIPGRGMYRLQDEVKRSFKEVNFEGEL